MTTPAVPPVTASLAALALSEGASFPPAARHAARRTIANAVGLAVGSSHHPAYELARGVLLAEGGPKQATLLGRGELASMTAAAFLGGLAAHVEDFDDTHLRTVIHPGAPIVPAVMAVGEYLDATYGAVVDSVLAGVEVALRVGNGICPGHFDRGWHLTSTTGRFGAAAGVGRLLGLSQAQIVTALSIAATEASGLQEALGTMTKSFHPGKAAADGLEAAQLARYGFTGTTAPIEGRRGFARTAAPDPDFQAITDGMGTVWEIEDNTFKPYACGIVSHPVIDAAISFRGEIRPSEVDHVVVRTHPVVLDVMGVEDPGDGLQSKFSVYHCFAVGLIDGIAGPQQFSDHMARRPDVVALRQRVSVVTDTTVSKDECFAVVRSTEGKVLTHHVMHATASAANPMTDAQLEAKITASAGHVLGDLRAGELARIALRAPDSLPVRTLVRLATPAPSTP